MAIVKNPIIKKGVILRLVLVRLTNQMLIVIDFERHRNKIWRMPKCAVHERDAARNANENGGIYKCLEQRQEIPKVALKLGVDIQ